MCIPLRASSWYARLMVSVRNRRVRAAGRAAVVGVGLVGCIGGDAADIRQSPICVDYLACAETHFPDEHAALAERYGPDGACWASSADQAQACAEECEFGLALVGGSHEHTDTDSGAHEDPDPCPLDAGAWSFTLTFREDSCGYSSVPNPWSASVSCDASELSLTLTNLGAALPCVVEDDAFTCELSEGYLVRFAGSAASGGRAATGSFELDLGCESAGSFQATAD